MIVVAAGHRLVVTVKVPAEPTVNVVWSALVIAGDGRHGQGERLVGVGRRRVGRGERQRVAAAGAGGRRAGQGGGAVTVVGEA